MGKLTVIPPLVTSKGPTVQLGQVNWNDIPTDVFAIHGQYRNCSQATQGDTIQRQVTRIDGLSITKTKTLETGKSETATISGKVSFPIGVDIGGSDGISISSKVTITSGEAENHTTQTQETITKPVSVPAMTYLAITGGVLRYSVPIPFSGTVVIDGTLSSNAEGLVSLSNVLPAEADRTFTFSGVITDASLMDDKTIVETRKLGDAECSGSDKNRFTVGKF